MLDNFNRQINYLRISVTDRCNLRCAYCMPEVGVKLLSHLEILCFDEIVEIVKFAVKNGIYKIRITGGEPLVRKGIVDLISQISVIKGIKDLSMTSNGILLEKFAYDLKTAGLQRINISLDTLNPDKFSEITRGGDIYEVYKGIYAAKKAGLNPIKINCVVLKSSNEKEALDVAEFCKKNDIEIRYINMMNLETGEYSVVEGGNGGNCKSCNRLRLTSNGMIKPCLFGEQEFNVRTLGIEQAFNLAIKAKPKCGTLNKNGKFYNIGG